MAWFEQSGHYPFLEEPQAFWVCVGTFLQEARAAPRCTVPLVTPPTF